jgi:nucleoid-associated protein YgaU
MPLEKAILINTTSGDRIAVQFNPEEYTLHRDNTFAQAAVFGLSAPLLQFAHGNMQTIALELLIDTYEAHAGSAAQSDVRALVRKVTDLMNIDPTTHAPPVVLFSWGLLSFTCVLASAQQKFIMFRPDGVPVRARVTVTLNEYTNADQESKEVKRETADYTKLYVTAQGETLSSIAARVYDNPATWRPIAIRNGLDETRHVAPGTTLLIPHLPYVEPETGEVMR